MTRFFFAAAAFCLLPLTGLRPALAHCEVPCGIYADQLRFEQMLEDTTTIRKAMGQIHQLADKHDGQSANQLARWVATKESHATNTQHIIAQYFMTQRIKASQEDYAQRLAAAHAVMVQAMRCKQTVAEAEADRLKELILAFHAIYAGEGAKKDAPAPK